jgi:GNAT superfamily N-acetyltransferase
VTATLPVSIRRARPDERRALEDLQHRSSLANPGDRAFLLANPDISQIPPEQIEQGLVSIAESDGMVVGLIALNRHDAPDMELEGLFVEPSCWRQGIGGKLVSHAVDLCRARGARKIVLFANTHAVEFYRAMDFEQTGVIAVDHNKAVVMVRKL